MRFNDSMIVIVLACLLFGPATNVTGQNAPVEAANYRLAERFSPTKLQRMVFSTRVEPKWLKTGDKFWYKYKTSQGTFYYLVDLEKQSRGYLFDNHEMARQLTLITKDPYDHRNLPDIDPKFVRGDRFFRFKVTGTEMVDVEDKKEEKEKKDEDLQEEENEKEKEQEKEEELEEKEIKEEKKEKEKDKEKDEGGSEKSPAQGIFPGVQPGYRRIV